MKEDEPVFSHSVAFLLKLASSLDPEFQPLRAAKRLDDYYIPTRYPNGLPGETPSEYFDDENEVLKALELSRKIVDLSERSNIIVLNTTFLEQKRDCSFQNQHASPSPLFRHQPAFGLGNLDTYEFSNLYIIFSF